MGQKVYILAKNVDSNDGGTRNSKTQKYSKKFF